MLGWLRTGGHLRREDAGGAVQRGEGLVELGHVAADGRLALDQVDLLAGLGQRQRRVDAGDAAAHHQHFRIDVHLPPFERPVQHHATDGGAHQVLGLQRGGGVILVHPRVVLADVHHLQEERIQTPVSQGFAEGVLVQQRRATGHHHAIQLELLNVLLDHLLAGVRAHVLVVARNDHVGKIGGEVGHRLAVHHPGDVGAAMADVDSDADVRFGFRHSSPPPRGTSTSSSSLALVPRWRA